MATWRVRGWIGAAAIAAAGAFVAVRGCGARDEMTTPAAKTAGASVAPRQATHRVAPPPETPGDAPAARGTVVVRVLAAEDDSPISGATVVTADTAEDVARRVTDADGTARFASLGASTRKFSASSPVRVTRFGECTVEAGGEATLVLRLVAAAVLRVRVEDRRTGAPIADAKIDVDVVGDEAEDHATTGDDGERLLLEPVDLVLRVSASASGFDETSTTVRTGARGAPSAPIVLRLSPLWRLTGVVRGPDGVAVPGAFVVVAPATAPLRPNAPEQPWSKLQRYRAVEAAANQQGEFVAAGLVPGRRYHAFARANESQWAPSALVEDIVVTSDAPEQAQDFALSQFGRLVVHVLTADGRPAAPLAVTVSFGNRMMFLQPDEAGAFVADRLPPGTATVSCTAAAAAALDVEIAAGGTVAVTLDSQTLPAVRGMVVDDTGLPVPGAEIQIQSITRSASPWPRFRKASADAQGAFVVATGNSGACSVSATAPGHQPSDRAEVQSPADGVRIVLRRAATLSFRATAESAFPREFDIGFDGDRPEVTARADANGAVRVDCEPLGDTHVRISTRGLPPVVVRATLTAGAVADLGDVSFPTPKAVRVHVADARGRPVAGAGVEHDSRNWAARNQMMFTTDADGNTVVFLGPPSGPFPLRVRAPGFLGLDTIADVRGDAPVIVTLARGGLLWGEIVDGSGLPSPDADVSVADARGAEVVTVTADRHGQFDVRVAPGRYTVRADSGTGVSVELSEGGDEHVQLVASAR